MGSRKVTFIMCRMRQRGSEGGHSACFYWLREDRHGLEEEGRAFYNNL